LTKWAGREVFVEEAGRAFLRAEAIESVEGRMEVEEVEDSWGSAERAESEAIIVVDAGLEALGRSRRVWSRELAADSGAGVWGRRLAGTDHWERADEEKRREAGLRGTETGKS